MFSQHQMLWKNPSQMLPTDLTHRSCAWCMLFQGDIRKLALKIQNELVPLYKPEIELSYGSISSFVFYLFTVFTFFLFFLVWTIPGNGSIEIFAEMLFFSLFLSCGNLPHWLWGWTCQLLQSCITFLRAVVWVFFLIFS